MVTETILDEIVRWKRVEVGQRKVAVSPNAVQTAAAAAPRPRDFAAALGRKDPPNGPAVRLIAEVKRASPSKGVLDPDLDAASLARQYEAHGASAVSVLTEERYFRGSLADLRAVGESVGLPVLCKDFVLDPFQQVYEARAAGADAILLIVAVLNDNELVALHHLAGELGMAVLVEVHNQAELDRALEVGPKIVGVNNRDLRTFQVDLETSARLGATIPSDVLTVAESGVHTRADVTRLEAIGVDAMLVGESLVRAEDVAGKIRELIG
jgi:indole-3-glycerol phosphate synthase